MPMLRPKITPGIAEPNVSLMASGKTKTAMALIPMFVQWKPLLFLPELQLFLGIFNHLAKVFVFLPFFKVGHLVEL